MQAPRIELYKTMFCGYCRRASDLLRAKGATFQEIDVTLDDARRAWLVQATGRTSVPQVFIDGKPVGGYTDLVALDRAGELDRMLRNAANE